MLWQEKLNTNLKEKQMKLSRKDELKLINLGLKVLLNREFSGLREPKIQATRGRKWSPEQRKKFIATMKAKRNKSKLRIA